MSSVVLRPLPPPEHDSSRVVAWFVAAVMAEVPIHDGTLAGSRRAAVSYARRAKADNTRRTYQAGVRAWCDWSRAHDLPCLPAGGRRGRIPCRRARPGLVGTGGRVTAGGDPLSAFIAGHPVPTAKALVSETMAGIRRTAVDGPLPRKALAATTDVVREMIGAIPVDFAGSRDPALILVGFASALRRAELPAVCVEHLEPDTKGIRLTCEIAANSDPLRGDFRVQTRPPLTLV